MSFPASLSKAGDKAFIQSGISGLRDQDSCEGSFPWSPKTKQRFLTACCPDSVSAAATATPHRLPCLKQRKQIAMASNLRVMASNLPGMVTNYFLRWKVPVVPELLVQQWQRVWRLWLWPIASAFGVEARESKKAQLKNMIWCVSSSLNLTPAICHFRTNKPGLFLPHCQLLCEMECMVWAYCPISSKFASGLQGRWELLHLSTQLTVQKLAHWWKRSDGRWVERAGSDPLHLVSRCLTVPSLPHPSRPSPVEFAKDSAQSSC